MAFTSNEEQKIRRLLSAWDSRKGIPELPEMTLSATDNGDSWWSDSDKYAFEISDTAQSPNSARMSLSILHSPKIYRQTASTCYIPLCYDVAICNINTEETSIVVSPYISGCECCKHGIAFIINKSGHSINLIIPPYFGMFGSKTQFYGMESTTTLLSNEMIVIGLVYDYGKNRENILRIYKIA